MYLDNMFPYRLLILVDIEHANKSSIEINNIDDLILLPKI